MANDNTLGAPTEGLGQNVTFVAGGAGSTPQARPGQRQAMRLNSQGGGAQLTARALQVPTQAPDPTMALLSKLGGELLRPHIEAERTARYVAGMQQAAQGEAITEIIDEQPWYSKLFGPSSVVDGARAYTAATKATSIAVGIEQDMDKLRSMGPEEFSKHAAGLLTSSNTGDAMTDAMIAQQIGSTLPQVMKSQAKEHLRFKQEVYEGSQLEYMQAGFALVGTVDAKARDPKSTTDQNDLVGQSIESAKILVRPEGMDEKLHNKLLATSATQAINSGNFAAYRLLKESGKYDQLSPEEQYSLDRANNQAGARSRLTVPDSFLVKMADFQTMAKRPGVKDADIMAAANAINAEYRQLTGDGSSYLGDGATVQELRQAREERIRLAEEAKRKAASAASATSKFMETMDANNNLLREMTAGQNVGPMIRMKDSDRQEFFDHARLLEVSGKVNPKVLNKLRVDVSGITIDKAHQHIVETSIGAALRSGDQAALHTVYETKYLPLVEANGDAGTSVARKYAGEWGEAMERYHRIARGKPISAMEQAGAYHEAANAKLTKLTGGKRDTEIVSELTTGRVMSVLGYATKDPEGLARLLAPAIPDSMDISSGVDYAKKSTPTLTTAAGYHWTRSVRDTSIHEYIGKNPVPGGVSAGDESLDKGLSYTASRVAKTAGIKGSHKIVQSQNGPNGVPQLVVQGTDDNGNPKFGLLTVDMIHADYKAGLGRLTWDDLVPSEAVGQAVSAGMPKRNK